MKSKYDYHISLGQALAGLRQERGSTQQELGNFLGVSKVAVSKWENELSLPDISLLPLLASYFNVSIDQLLDYDAQLSDEQVQAIYTQLAQELAQAQNQASKKSSSTGDSTSDTATASTSTQQVWNSIQTLTKRYYSSPSLLLSMGIFLLNHYDLLPGAMPRERAQYYLSEACNLFTRVRELSSDAKLTDKANTNQAYCLLALGRPQDVLNLLGEHMDELYPVESLIATADQQLGRSDEALETLQASIFQYATVLLNQLANYLPLLQSSPAHVIASDQRGEALIEAFHLDLLSPIIALNFRLYLAAAYAELGIKQGAHKALQAYADLLESTDFPVTRHGDDYFDRIDHWLQTIGVDPLAPRLRGQYEQRINILPFQHPALAKLLQSEDFAELAARLTAIDK
ncbi:transcriptional regulator [Bombiscardovia nodaiensis]|uniref:Transcriptional regulator n=1 Tax=Bombiscardovia nodaiensis TaxID=2932181 RepID=A0ABN6SAY1_9BIFI|nr:transcriptional regulator [Bombiscardovia nodaiensis]